MAVKNISGNYWLNQFNLQNLGGVLGLGYNYSINATYANNFWDYLGKSQMKFSINFAPSIYDFAWNPNISVEGAPSYMYFGDIDPASIDYVR